MDTTPIWAIIIDSAESIVTVVAIVIAGIFAWRNGIIFRHRSPHINITHEVSHRAVSEEYIHLAVTLNLDNGSNVKVEFRDALFVLQHLAPMADAEVEDLYYDVPEHQQVEEPFAIQWEKLEEIWCRWDKDDFSVEPGETKAYTIEFVVHSDVASVLITTYMYNSRTMGKIDDDIESPIYANKQKRRLLRWREIEGPRGWPRVTAHGIVPFKFNAEEEMERTDAR